MSYSPSKIANLIVKHLHNALKAKEKEILQSWLSESEKNRLFFEETTTEANLQKKLQEFSNIHEEPIWGKIAQAIQQKKLHSIPLYTRWRLIAAVFVILLAGTIFLLLNRPFQQHNFHQYANDIPPGSNKAILTLSDGSTLVLDSLQTGNIAKQKNINIIKLRDGQLVYNNAKPDSLSPLKKEMNLPPNSLVTPRGGQYQITLADGTKVWLNAASEIKFPTVFTGKERKVEVIKGEAYFEVVKNELMPFIVNINNKARVKVLGTHFNINAYENEAAIRTTLLEGSVQIQSLVTDHSLVVVPGEEVTADLQGNLKTEKVDVNETIAWKDGLFQFNSEDISSIMKKIERWYDIEIIYESSKPDIRLSGVISRNVTISNVLKMFEMSGVHFSIEGKKVTVLDE